MEILGFNSNTHEVTVDGTPALPTPVTVTSSLAAIARVLLEKRAGTLRLEFTVVSGSIEAIKTTATTTGAGAHQNLQTDFTIATARYPENNVTTVTADATNNPSSGNVISAGAKFFITTSVSALDQMDVYMQSANNAVVQITGSRNP